MDPGEQALLARPGLAAARLVEPDEQALLARPGLLASKALVSKLCLRPRV